jgi:hypothetical protein
MGFSRVNLSEISIDAKRNGIALVLISLIIICVPLGYNGYNISINNNITQTVEAASGTWLGGSGYELTSVNTQSGNDTVIVRILGNGPLPPIDNLEKLVKGKIYGKNIRVDVIYSNSYLVNS